MYCKMLFLERIRRKTFVTPYIFVKIIPLNYWGQKERVLKRSVFDIEPGNVADIISCSVCCPSGRDFIKEILRGLICSYLKKLAKFSKPSSLL